jgi:hypothetical protein
LAKNETSKSWSLTGKVSEFEGYEKLRGNSQEIWVGLGHTACMAIHASDWKTDFSGGNSVEQKAQAVRGNAKCA